MPMTDVFNLGIPGPSGNENDTYIGDDGYVYKVNNLMNSKSIVPLLERLALHNQYFPNSAYELVGFTGFDGGSVYPVVRQRYVSDASPASTEEIDAYMRSLGFAPTGREAEYSNSEVTISDLRPRNVLKSESGNIYVIDAEFAPAQANKFTPPLHEENEGVADYAKRVVEAKKLHDARQQVETHPTEAQKEAGNYPKGHVKIDGFDITIENPRGSVRSGMDANGKAWSTTMRNDYGYIRRTEGVDGDHIDVFLSEEPTRGDVYVIDQVDPNTGKFDEHKVMYGFGSEEAARVAYLSNYEDGWQGLGNITRVSKEDFKTWIGSSHRKTKPFAEYKTTPNPLKGADRATSYGLQATSSSREDVTFAEAIDRIFAGDTEGLQQKFFDVADTPAFMKQLGITGDKFTLSYGTISRHIKKDASHTLTVEIWKQLPKAIQTPFAITSYRDGKKDGYRIYTNIEVNGGYVVAGIDVKTVGRNMEVNSISTVFGKEGGITQKEEVLYESETITPRQKALLAKPNSSPYLPNGEVSDRKGSETSANEQKTYGANNKLVSTERYEELKRRMRDKLRGQMNMGIDPEILAIGTEMAAYHIEAGARKFADYAKRMIADLGDTIRPYLKSFYNGARDLPEVTDAGLADEMTPYEEVRTFDTANFDKTGIDMIATANMVAQEQKAQKQAEEAKEILTEQLDAIVDGLRPATEEDIRNNRVVFYNGLAYRVSMIVESGEQVGPASFSKPRITSVYLHNGQEVSVDELSVRVRDDKPVKEAHEAGRSERGNKQAGKKETKKKSVSSQPKQVDMFGLFADLYGKGETRLSDHAKEPNEPKQTDNEHGRSNQDTRTNHRGTEPRPEKLPASEPVGAGTPVQDAARDSQGQRVRTRNGSGQSGTRPQYDVNRNYTNEEIGEIVASVTDIVDGKVVLTGEVTDDLKSIVRQYKSGGVAKQGRGILDEYYTDGKIVDAVNLLIAPYFKTGKAVRVLEPSVGIGNFIGALRGIPTSEVRAFEINETTARIAKVLYPQAEVNLRSFETEFIDEEGNKKPLPKKYGLVIGNPPYGSHRGLYKGLGEESKIARYEDYFVKRSLDVLNDGGVLAMVLPSSWIDRHTDYGGYTVEAAYRLPSGAFEATQVGTDIVVLRKDSSVPRAEHAPYFEQHPERVLGVVKQRKGRYGRLEDYVEGDIDAAIEAIEREQAAGLTQRLGMDETGDNVDAVQSAIEETGSADKAAPIVKAAQTTTETSKPTKPAPAKASTGKYKLTLNRGAEAVPASRQFTHPFSEEEVEAFADTDYDGTLHSPEEHRRYANYINGEYVHDFYYAEGDIYSKLEQLERDKRRIIDLFGQTQYDKQKRLLESVLPKRKGLDEITISPNTAFVKNLQITTGDEAKSLKDLFIDFCRKLPYQAFGDSSAWEVIGYVNNEQVYGQDKRRNQLVRERRKRAANDLFVKFLHEELPVDAQAKVAAAFNREYNSTYRPDYSKVPIFSSINKDFKGKDLKLTSVQLAGIGRMTVKGVGVLAHEVGFGKTLSGVLAMHEAMTRGFARKPLIVVPNDNILQQWVETINEALPNATVNTLGNLGASYDLSDFKVNDGEFTIITYEGLKAMSFHDDTYDRLGARFSYITEDLKSHKTERDKQQAIEKRKELKGKMKRGTKRSYNFEDFGFDWLTFDEVHNANHIVSKVRLDKSVASDFRSQSQRTSDLGMKTWIAAQYIQEQNNGRNVLLLSATPFTNKPLEYYSILSLVGNDMLRRKGFFNVDQFFETFMEADNELEIAANGRPVQKTNIRRFKNNGLFQQLLSEFIDIKGEEDNPDLVRPERRNKEYKIAQNELTAEAMEAVQDLLGDNETVLQGIGHARAAAFSPYATPLLGLRPKGYKDFVENSPKIDAAIKLIEQNKKDRPEAGQIIYSEVGVEFFPMIRDYLVKESGFKPEEVRIITGATSNAERIAIQTAFNEGKVKVVIGSPAIKEGLNLQENTTDMYILSLPWNFTQLRQIEGRGWRQGNKWENIRINYLLTNDSIDVFMLQRLQLKQGLYNEAMKSGAESLDVSDIDTSELKTALITDPNVRAEIETVQERGRLQQEKTRIEADLSFMTRKYEAYNKVLEELNSQKLLVNTYRQYAKNNRAGDSYWENRAKEAENKLPLIEKKIEQEKQNLLKKGIDVADMERRTEQSQQAAEAIQRKIDDLENFQRDLAARYRREAEAKSKEQGNMLATYLKERRDENRGGFYKIRPKEDAATSYKLRATSGEGDVLYRLEDTKDRIEALFNKAVSGDLKGKPISIGTLTKEGKDYLEKLSGITFKDRVDFVLNPSDLVHIYKRHFGSNEKDGRNIPLDIDDIRSIADIISNPDKVIFSVEENAQERKMFSFLKEADRGSYNLLEIYSDKKGNLTAKSFYKSKEGVPQRAISLTRTLHSTSETGGATLNTDAKIPQLFENPPIPGENLRTGDGAYTDDELSYENDPWAKMGRRRTAAQRRAFAERERQRMVTRVQELAEKLHLSGPLPASPGRGGVEIVTDISTLEGRKAKAKGFYNPRTGKITIVIPNHTSVQDVEQTLLHEAVAHHGLRELFGEHFDTFLENVFENADEDIRADIRARAERGSLDTRTATEEYLASLAENTNFEDVNASWWQKIKQAFLRMLHAIGFEGFTGVTLTDNELRYLLWRSYENLREPGSRLSILGIVRDTVKQAELGLTPNPLKGADKATSYELQATSSSGERVADSGEAASVNERFNEQLAGLTEENADRVALSLGRPSAILRAAGVDDKPMKLYGNKVIKKMKKHGFKLEELSNLPQAVADPIAVFRGSTEGSFAILTDLKIGDKHVLVSLSVGKDNDIDFNIISSVYGKNGRGVVDWILKGKTLYVNKKKALDYLRISAPIAEAQDNQELDDATKVIENFENPSIGEEIYRIGGTKRIGGGRTITFTRANPTATFNALKKRLDKEGVNYEWNKAKTGSRYITFERNGIDYQVRSANHTSGEYGYYNPDEDGIDVYFDDNKISEVGIDLSRNEMGVSDLFDLMKEAESVNSENIDLNRYGENQLLPSVELVDRYPILAGSIDKYMRMYNLSWINTSRRLHDEYNAYAQEATPGLLPFTARNGVTIEKDGTYTLDGEPTNKLGKIHPAQDEYRRAVEKARNKHVRPYMEWISQTHPEIAENLRRNAGERSDGVLYREADEPMPTFMDLVRDGIVKASMKPNAAAETKLAALKILGQDVNRAKTAINKAQSGQREDDREGVKMLTELANKFLSNGLLDGVSAYEAQRLLSAVKNATGKQDLREHAYNMMDVLVNARLKEVDKLTNRLLRTKTVRTSPSGVAVMAQVDARTATMLKELRELLNQHVDAEALQDRLVALGDKETEASRAESEAVGLALSYIEEVETRMEDLRNLRNELKDAQDELEGKKGNERKAQKELVRTLQEGVLESMAELADAKASWAGLLQNAIVGGMAGRMSFVERKQQRRDMIRHFANSDLQGVKPSFTEQKGWRNGAWKTRLANNLLVQGIMSPFHSLSSHLKFFGRNAVGGEGYLYNHFMPEVLEANGKAYDGFKAAVDKLNGKSQELFGEKRYVDVVRKLSKADKIGVSYRDANGERVDAELSQGNALYIYMVNKMADGRMKLRKMGITEEDVQTLKEKLDPRAVEMADWIQGELLPSLRVKYDQVHEQLFGVPMDKVENYFPINTVRSEREQPTPESSEGDKTKNTLMSTVTGNIKRRVKNTVALDIFNTDALALSLDHVRKMEEWAAFAPVREDFNMLLSYRTFRRRLKNMPSIYGAGEKLYNNFVDSVRVAVGQYNYMPHSLESGFANVARGVAVSKIGFNLNSALKQALGYPAILGDADLRYIAESMVRPGKAWKWSMENLPNFRERVDRGLAGNTHIDIDENAQWEVWRTRLGELAVKWGMKPNALMDELMSASIAYATYRTKLEELNKIGVPSSVAERKALFHAERSYNETQSSNVGAFLSSLQRSTGYIQTLVTVFKNAPIAYTRRLIESVQSLNRSIRNHQEMLEFTRKQLVRDGVPEARALDGARRLMKRRMAKDVINVALFGYAMQVVWLLGSEATYLLFGGDDDEKEEILENALVGGSVSPILAVPFMGAGSEWLLDWFLEGKRYGGIMETPLTQDVKYFVSDVISGDLGRAANSAIELAVASGIGLNLETLTNMVVGVWDAVEDGETAGEKAGMGIARFLNMPQPDQRKLLLDAYLAGDGTVLKDYIDNQIHRDYGFLSPMYIDDPKVRRRYYNRFMRERKSREKLKSKK